MMLSARIRRRGLAFAVFAVGVIAPLPGGPTAAAAAEPGDVLAVWRMDERVELTGGPNVVPDADPAGDRVAEGRALVLRRGAKLAEVEGAEGQALVFDGNKQFARTISDVAWGGDTDRSSLHLQMRLWISPDGQPDEQGLGFVAEVPGVWRLWVSNDGERLVFLCFDEAGKPIDQLARPIARGEWVEVEASFVEGVMEVEIDGQRKATEPSERRLRTDQPGPVVLGSNGGARRFFVGQVDDVVIRAPMSSHVPDEPQ
jgi:hypothetical protein